MKLDNFLSLKRNGEKALIYFSIQFITISKSISMFLLIWNAWKFAFANNQAVRVSKKLTPLIHIQIITNVTINRVNIPSSSVDLCVCVCLINSLLPNIHMFMCGNCVT